MATPEEMAQKMLSNLEDKTGKPLADWKKLLAKQNFDKHGQMVKFLKSEHGVTHGFANLIAHETRGSAAQHSSSDDLVSAQYSGAKADLKPIYDRADPGDQQVRERRGSVAQEDLRQPSRRKKQFALIKPATKTRIDIGIQLKGETAKVAASPGVQGRQHDQPPGQR